MKLKFLSLLLFIGVLSGCSLDDGDRSCFYQAAMATTAVTGPETAVVNTVVTYNVTFYVANGCGTFNSLQQSAGFPKSVVALVDYSGCNCPEVASYVTKPFTFTPTAAGTYEFRFLTDDEATTIVKTLTVTAE
jgi:hypothetical protein